MEIALSYYPVIHTAPINRCGLAVLKLAGHVTQKFAYIGSDGLLKCYRFDKNQLNQRFMAASQTNHPECVVADNDNLIVSQNKNLVFYNRKGASFKTETIPFDNSITALLVHNGAIHVATGTMCNTLGVQESTIVFDSPIVGFAAVKNVSYVGISTGSVFSFVAGASQLVHTLHGSLTMIASVQRTKTESLLAVGCSDNKLRFFDSLDKEVSSIELQSPPTAISEFDLDKDGFPELFVALENGNVCLLSISIIETPKVLATISIGFAASNIAAGFIYSANLVSAIVTSQSGHLGIVSAEPRKDRSLLSSIAPKVTEQELSQLQRDVSALESQMKSASSKPPVIPVQTKIELRGDPISESFCLIVECERPISKLALSATMPVTIKSRSDCQTMVYQARRKPPVSSGVIKAVDPSATRITVDLFYEAGKGGELQVFVNYWNSSAVYNQEFQLKPFGLLKKLSTNPLSDLKDDSLSLIEISTTGTSAVFHDIINNCLPFPVEEGTPMAFSSGCIGAPLTVFLSGDKFIARSVFFPVIVQIRNYILSAMNLAKQSVSFETNIGANCISEFFNQIKERFFFVNSTALDYMKLVALQEVRNHTAMSSKSSEPDNDETIRLMQDAEEIERQYGECSNEYKTYLKVIEEFYIEMWKKANINAGNQVEELHSVLKETRDDESLKVLISFMSAQPEK